jgi:mRNA interferase RelE/StbE
MAYTVELSPRAERDLKKMTRPAQVQVATALSAISENPRCYSVSKLTDRDAYRYRSGDFRILFEIFDSILRVIVLSISNRKDAYR